MLVQNKEPPLTHTEGEAGHDGGHPGAGRLWALEFVQKFGEENAERVGDSIGYEVECKTAKH